MLPEQRLSGVKIPEAYISQHVSDWLGYRILNGAGFLYLWIISPAHGRNAAFEMLLMGRESRA